VLADAHAQLGAHVGYTLTDSTQTLKEWQGAQGRVNERMIAAQIPDYRERWSYLSGPPKMVRTTGAALRKLGAPRSYIKRDYFPGLT